MVDASVALKWFVPEEMSGTAAILYGAGYQLVAPRLSATEIANALVCKTMRGELSRQEAAIRCASLGRYLPDLIDVDDLIAPAFETACLLRHPIYDLIYLETARRLDAQLITADRRFIAKLANTDLARHVTFLSDWQPE